MIRGFFSPTHIGNDDPAPTQVPLLEAFLYLPCIDANVVLQFLVDTGADVTVLHDQDSLRLVLTDAHWKIVRSFPQEDFGGAGAGRPYHGVPAILILSHDDGSPQYHSTRIWIAEPGGPNGEHESLFGRDLLENFTLTFIQPTDLILESRTT